MLNAGFKLNGEDYWRVDDLDRIEADTEAGTYSPLDCLRRFGIAISQHNCDYETARKLVDAMNKALGE